MLTRLVLGLTLFVGSPMVQSFVDQAALIPFAAFFPLPPAPLPWASEQALPSEGSPRITFAELPQEPRLELSERVLIRLVEAEAQECDAWYRDDYRIARVTVGLARQGSPIPHIEACYAVLGIHPDQVWPRIVARRQAVLMSEYADFFGSASSPKKPVRSVGMEGLQREKAA
jgi:hypothetical protein